MKATGQVPWLNMPKSLSPWLFTLKKINVTPLSTFANELSI